MAYESSNLTAAEQNYPAHVLELLAVIHALRVFRHFLLGGGAPRPAGCWSDFDLRTDNQAITWLKTNRHLNKMYVRWLDEIRDFSFDVTHLPGSRNPTDPLSRSGFADGADPAASTGDADAESQQELFSRLGRDAPVPARLATVRARWAATRRAAAETFADVQGGDTLPSASPRGGALSPSCQSMFVALAGAELALGTGMTTAPSPPVPSNDFFLSPTFVMALAAELTVDAVFGPIMRGAAAALGQLVDRVSAPIVEPARASKGGAFLARCVRDALIALFETPVSVTNVVGRKVLTRVLGNSSINFDKPILDFTNNRHLEAMTVQRGDGCIPVVWESKERKESNAKTVLSSIKYEGQEILEDFLGNDPPPYICSSMYVLMQL